MFSTVLRSLGQRRRSSASVFHARRLFSVGGRPPPYPPGGGGGDSTVLLTTQRKIVFPPNGSGPFRLYAALVIAMATLDIYAFYTLRDTVDDATRQARSGVAMLGPQAAAKSLRTLDDIASGAMTGASMGTNSDFPNFFPRIFRQGGLEAIRLGLESNEYAVVYAASTLAHTACARPKACRMFMEDDALRGALVKSLKHAAEAKGCEDCGQPSAEHMVALLDVFRACLPYYPFGKDPATDEMLRASLERIAARTVHFAMKNNGADDIPGPLILEPPVVPPFFDGLRRNPLSQGHDPFWYLSVADVLMDICQTATFHSKQSAEKVLPILVEPILLPLVQLYEMEAFDEEKSLGFLIACAEVLPHSKGFDPALARIAETINTSRILSHSFLRRSAFTFLDNLDTLGTIAFAGTFGYIWGVVRSLIALRHAQPPTNVNPVPPTVGVPYGNPSLSVYPQGQPMQQVRQPGAAYGAPFPGAQQPNGGTWAYGPQPGPASGATGWTEPRAWRWMMSRQYGFRALLGATAFLSWHHLMTRTFAWPIWIENDHLQAAFEVTKVFASVGVTGFLFTHTPFFFFPAFVGYLTGKPVVGDDSFEITFGPWTRGPGFPGGGGSSEGRWT